MIIHPDHAMDLAAIRHRELVARADEFRTAGRFGFWPAARTPDPDCRVPAGVSRRPACRPDSRSSAAAPAGRRRPRHWLRGHRKPNRVG
ncbi:MAG: hypothetical protein GEV12_09335 [Micromonosporaceae bacterium]|nr:hypothetical protein [Micromonosporaceae bacterium]